MKQLLIFCLLLALLAGCSGPLGEGAGLAGSGRPISRSFDLDGFSRIDANSAAQVVVTHGETFKVEVQVDDNVADRLEVQVRGNTLIIKLREGTLYSNVTLKAQVTMPELTGIKLNGASTLTAEQAGEKLDVDLNGASRATLTGSAGSLTIVANGAGQALLAGMTAGDVKLDANGASHVEVRSQGTVRGKANGASTVIVAGEPTEVDVSAEGASRVITK